MSITTQPPSNSPNPPAKGVSMTTLVLSLALAVSASVAATLAVVHFWQPTPAGRGGDSHGPLAAILGDEPLVQKDTVQPQHRYTGLVYYPVPYGSPPNLKLTTAKRQYDIIKQDETGFTWMARPTVEDFKDDMRKVAEENLKFGISGLVDTYLKPNIQYEDFAYEARGVRADKSASAMRTFEQTGTFTTVAGKDGEVSFAIPFAIAPNVELSGRTGHVVIVECRPTGFKWKNGGKDDFFESGSVTWTAKGLRATEIPKPTPQ
jgi:hypothetical protein